MADFTDKTTLKSVAYHLAEEIRDGRWNHVPGITTEPVRECDELVAEFERRCPGFSRVEYQRALADALFESR